MAQRLPPEIESKVARYQALQTQYNRVVQERVAVEAEIAEINRVLEVLNNVPQDTPVYRLLGTVLVKVERDKVVSELNDRKEILELRLQRLKRQEEELKKQLDQLVKEIREVQAKLAGAQPARTGGGG
jgi:prefoldin beta subunit